MASRARVAGRNKNQPIAKRLNRDANRGTPNSRGYDRTWREFRLRWLAANPFCTMCQAAGRVELGTVVDHITPHRGNIDVFWQVGNHQSLCKPCHDRKTAAGN